jgi:hypothetical protein
VKDPYTVLLQKEKDIQRVRHEIEVLRSVLPLLDEQAVPPVEETTPPKPTNKWPLEVTGSR